MIQSQYQKVLGAIKVFREDSYRSSPVRVGEHGVDLHVLSIAHVDPLFFSGLLAYHKRAVVILVMVFVRGQDSVFCKGFVAGKLGEFWP
jgi:hypothetical protein